MLRCRFRGTGYLCLPLVLGLQLGGPTAATAQNWQAVEIETIPVADNIFMLRGRGGNIGVSVGADGVFLIDDQFAPLTDKILAAVKTLSNQPIRFLLNTHWHGDHTGGNENLGEAGTVIVAHDRVRDRLIEKLARTGGGEVGQHAGLPVVTFSETVTFHLNGESVVVTRQAPAHTDGDSIVHFPKANVIHMGDVYFNGLYSFFDASSGGSFDGMIAALEWALARADGETRIIPGHGALSNRGELEDHLKRLVMIRERTLAALDDGLSLREFVAAKPTADLEAAYSGTYKVMEAEKFLDIVYSNLERQQK